MTTPDTAVVEPIFDNTGGSAPDVKPRWDHTKLPWPVGPYTGRYSSGDPREALRRATEQGGRDGYVLVKASELRAAYEMRVCRSTHDFDRDEDGPMARMTAHCVYEAGHVSVHSNGYYSWAARAEGT